MAVITISSEDLASILGKTSSEIEAHYIKDGEPLPPNEVGKLLGTDVSAKITSVVEKEKNRLDADGVRRRARAEVFGNIEKKLKAIGAEGENWEEQIQHLEDNKGSNTEKEITISDIKNSEVFRTTVDSLKSQIDTEKQAHEATRTEFTTNQQKAQLSSFVNRLLTDPVNGFVIGEDEEVKSRKIRHLMRDIEESGHKIVIENGNPKLLDEKGQPAQDNAYNDIDPVEFVKNNAKYLFQQKVSEPKEGTPYIAPKDDKGQSIHFPVMQTESDLGKAVDQAIMEKKGSDYVKALYTHFDETRPK